VHTCSRGWHASRTRENNKVEIRNFFFFFSLSLSFTRTQLLECRYDAGGYPSSSLYSLLLQSSMKEGERDKQRGKKRTIAKKVD